MKKIFSLISILIISSFAFAKTNSLSIQMVQNNPGQDKVWATTLSFEQSMIDFYFDSGKIVSNSPVHVKSLDEEKNKKALKAAIIENNDGGMMYLVRVELFFKTSKDSVPDVPMLSNISNVEWKIFNVMTGLEVSSGTAQPEKVTTSNNNELGIDKFARLVAQKVESSL